jgi:hypothetical protein
MVRFKAMKSLLYLNLPQLKSRRFQKGESLSNWSQAKLRQLKQVERLVICYAELP